MPVKKRAVRKKAAPKKIYRSRRPKALTGYGAYKAVENDNAKDAYARGKAAGLRSKKRQYDNNEGIGSKIGSAIGSGIGQGAEHFVRWLTGYGDYDVKQNVLLAQDPPPMYNESNKGGTLIRHREFIKDVYSGASGAFNIDSFYINPANTKTFPWLSQIAANYEQYSLEGVIFEFRSMSSDALNSTNTALGSVIMATNYDSLDNLFQSKAEMENYEFGASCKPSACMMHPIECAPKLTALTELYTLSGAAPGGSDLRLYHWGNFQIATIGMQNATPVNLGELWVTYQVRLIKPKLFDALGKEVASFKLTNNSYTNALPLGNGTSSGVLDTIGVFYDPANNNIGLPILSVRRHYLVTIYWIGSATAITHATPSFTNAVLTDFGYVGGGNNFTCPVNGTVTGRCQQTFSIMTVANTFPVISMGAAGTLPTTGSSVVIEINQINPFQY